MSQILALSFDCISSPRITLQSAAPVEDNTEQTFGRGFSWYNYDELSTTIVKETRYHTKSVLTNTMSDSSRFRSSIFMGHVRGAAKRIVQKDTQPFSRSYAGRDWLFIHNGDLKHDYKACIPVDENPFFEPIGSTDSEYIFCYLLEKIKKLNVRSLANVGWQTIHDWLKEINEYGTLNLMISDGLDLVVYHDKNVFNPLYWFRSAPPHYQDYYETDYFSIKISTPHDIKHTFILVSNQNINKQCEKMKPCQMLILRRGKILWDSTHSVQHEKQLNDNIKSIHKLTRMTQANEHISTHHNRINSEEIRKYKEVDRDIIDYSSKADRVYYSAIHTTIYRYEQPVNMSWHLFHLHPTHDLLQSVHDYKLHVSARGQGEFFEDVFGNITTTFKSDSPYKELVIHSESIVSVADVSFGMSDNIHRRRDIPLVWLPKQTQMMSPYLLPVELPESELNQLIEFAMSFVKRNDYDLIEVLNDINWTIHSDFEYMPGSTSLASTPYDLYIHRQGVCQDFTNLFICLARLLNIPARYRTGYIYGHSSDLNKSQSQASHAWVEVYLPYIGWYGFDPTNGCTVQANHIRVACGRNYLDATPTSGTIYQGGGHEQLEIKVQINRLTSTEITRLLKGFSDG